MGDLQGQWLNVVQERYLKDYISRGGASFKMALVGNESSPESLLSDLRDVALSENCIYAEVSAKTTRIDRIEHLFYSVARQIDWQGLAATQAIKLLREAGYSFPDDEARINTEEIAQYNSCSVGDLNRDLRLILRNEVESDHLLCKDFRTAINKLCHAQFFTKTLTPNDSDTVIGWLCGEKVGLKPLRELGIYARISRQNARDMLKALSRWLGSVFGKPLVIGLDLSVMAQERKRGMNVSDGFLYTRNNCLDVYEVFRQFIDDTDDTSYCLICAVGTMDLYQSEKRSFMTYLALKSRLINEVYDRRRPNMLAPMVFLHTADMEGVQ